jgi:hypothetical protein
MGHSARLAPARYYGDVLFVAKPCAYRFRAAPRHYLSTWTGTDDWPERAPVAEAEVEVFERWFADLFYKLFGPCR